jgi:predicted lipid-binding transport protein (Tim44 family)
MKHRMSKLLVAVTLACLCFSGIVEAKRLGGGVSSGISRNNVMKRDLSPPAPPAPAQSAAAPVPSAPTPMPPAPARSGIWGMLGGLALGVGLGALLSHFGLGAEVGGLLLVLLLGFGALMLFRMLAGSRQPVARPLQYATAAPSAAAAPQPQDGGPAGTATSIPAGFDVDGFVRQAKRNFVRLQAANDVGNLDDIRQFTTPEMFAEIQLQFQERGRATQQTDVVQLEAQLLDVTSEADRHLASVRFHGLLRESADSAPAGFDEVWHLSKPTSGSAGWVIAGIQQFA